MNLDFCLLSCYRSLGSIDRVRQQYLHKILFFESDESINIFEKHWRTCKRGALPLSYSPFHSYNNFIYRVLSRQILHHTKYFNKFYFHKFYFHKFYFHKFYFHKFHFHIVTTLLLMGAGIVTMKITYLTQWLEYRFHTARVIGSNPIVGKTY